MTQVQVLRSNVAGARPAAGSQPPGVMYVNWPDKQLGVFDAAGNPIDLIPMTAADLGAAPADHTHDFPVDSVNGLTGDVVLTHNEVGAAAVDHNHAGVYSPADHTHDFPVDSVNGKTGDVVLTAADVGAAPTAHSHAIADVTGLQTSLDGKAPVVHTHVIADVTGLQPALDGKAPVVHSHPLLSADAGNTSKLGTDGLIYTPLPAAGSSVTASDTPPASPAPGDLWYCSTDGQLYVYYTDADSSQWVSATGGAESVDVSGFVKKTGDTMTGKLDVDATASAAIGVVVSRASGASASMSRNGFYVGVDKTFADRRASLDYNDTTGSSLLTLKGNSGYTGWSFQDAGSAGSGVVAGCLYLLQGFDGKQVMRVAPGTDPAICFGNTTGFTAGDATFNIQEAYLGTRCPLRVDAPNGTTNNLTRWTKSGAEVARIDLNGAYQNNSDERLKMNIQALPHGLAAINSLEPKMFQWKTDARDMPKYVYGLIAQQVLPVLPEPISEGTPGPDGVSYLGIDTAQLIPVLINAVKELTARLEALEGAAK